MSFHLLQYTFCRCIIIIFRSVKRSISTYCPKTQSHGGISIRIEITRCIHPTDSPIQKAFSTNDFRSRCLRLHIHIEQHCQHINAQWNSRIVENLIGSVPFKKTLQTTRSSQLRTCIKAIYESFLITIIFLCNSMVDFRQESGIHFWAILLQQRRKYFLVYIQIQIRILFDDILQTSNNSFLLSFKVKVQNLQSKLHQFRSIQERLDKVSLRTVYLPAVLIIQFQVGKQLKKLLTFFRVLLYPPTDFLLHFTLLI